MNESLYLSNLKNKNIPLDPCHLQELEILEAMVRTEDRSWLDTSWRGEWTKKRYRQLREKYSKAYEAFETELWEEKGRDESKIRTRRNLEPSPYIEQMMKEVPDSEEKERYLKELRKFKDAMVHMRLGYGSQPMAYILTIWKGRYPKAHEAFKKELGR